MLTNDELAAYVSNVRGTVENWNIAGYREKAPAWMTEYYIQTHQELLGQGYTFDSFGNVFSPYYILAPGEPVKDLTLIEYDANRGGYYTLATNVKPGTNGQDFWSAWGPALLLAPAVYGIITSGVGMGSVASTATGTTSVPLTNPATSSAFAELTTGPNALSAEQANFLLGGGSVEVSGPVIAGGSKIISAATSANEIKTIAGALAAGTAAITSIKNAVGGKTYPQYGAIPSNGIYQQQSNSLLLPLAAIAALFAIKG